MVIRNLAIFFVKKKGTNFLSRSSKRRPHVMNTGIANLLPEQVDLLIYNDHNNNLLSKLIKKLIN